MHKTVSSIEPMKKTRKSAAKSLTVKSKKTVSSGKKTAAFKTKPVKTAPVKLLSYPTVTPAEVDRIINFYEANPFYILGPHILENFKCVVIRAYLPRAVEAWICLTDRGGDKIPMRRIHPAGFYELIFKEEHRIFPYKIGFKDASGYIEEKEDPYAFGTEISDFDLYLISEGTHYRSYEKFGAHLMTFHDTHGVHFAVWAPNAESVSVVGNFNHWKVGAHPMTKIRFSGIWGLFIPGLGEGEVYKFAVKSWDDHQVRLKSDPYGFSTELRPQTASVVTSINHYQWEDQPWIERRRTGDPYNQPVSIYEVHLGSWKRGGENGEEFLDYKTLAKDLVEYVKYMGYTHIELLPVMEHPLDESWGYQVVNYYAPTSRFGKPRDFMYFIDYCHQNGIGVLLDWVPAHFPKDSHGLADFDGRQIYAYEGWKKGEHKDWGTLVFDYGRNEVRNFLISNALFWLDKYHLDGLRVDAVASILYLDYSRKEGEWEPNVFGGRENLEAIDFIKKFNEVVHSQFPGVLTIAEESTSWGGVSRPTYTGGLGFGMKWNMGWMHDTLEYFSKDPVHRRFHQGMLTFSMLYAFTENFVLPISHDEVVHGKGSLIEKMPGDDWQKFANARLFYGYMFGHPGKKLLFMGNDIGQRAEWDAKHSMDWHLMQYEPHQKLHSYVKDLLHLYKEHPAFYEVDFEYQGFEWVDFSDADASLVSFLRWSRDRNEVLLCVYNMTPVPRMGYRIGAPMPGYYRELLNSDAREYGGSGIGNLGGVHSQDVPWQFRSHSVLLNLPPLGALILKCERG